MAFAGCSDDDDDDDNPVDPGGPDLNRSFMQIDRLGNPLVSEVMLAKRTHGHYNAVGPASDPTFAAELESFVTGVAVRSETVANTLSSVLLPDELIVDTSRSPATASWLSWALSAGWGGRKLTDDVVDIGLDAIFGDAIEAPGTTPGLRPITWTRTTSHSRRRSPISHRRIETFAIRRMDLRARRWSGTLPMKRFLFGASAVVAATMLAWGLQAREDGRAVAARTLTEEEVRTRDIAFYEERILRDPEGSIDLAQLAGLYLQRSRETANPQDVERAEQLARKSLAASTLRNGKARHLLASSLLAQHRFAEGRIEAQALVDAEPDVPGYRALLGELQIETGDLDEARRTFEWLEQDFQKILARSRISRSPHVSPAGMR